MKLITSLVLAAFAVYTASWVFGLIQGNAALLLFWLTTVCGLYWLAEKFYFLRRHRAAVAGEHDAARVSKTQLRKANWWLDWTAGMFPVLLVVFVIRSFVFEPFKIPSPSMVPTLLVGDMILVNKFEYGLRLPVLQKKITQGSAVQRGDVVVFRYPPQPNLDYIKRVIGVPGDEISYLNKQLTINGQLASKEALPGFVEEESGQTRSQFSEQIGTSKHLLLNSDASPARIETGDFHVSDSCKYSNDGVKCKVPAGHYFVMGDNRDNSVDSRYWGFVPENNMIGKAVFIWLNLGNLKRIGGFN
jgi:signal peptidase I